MTPNSKIPALENTVRFWQLVIIKVRFSLRSEASQSYLSYAWWILEPLLQMGVFYVVFDILLNRGTEDFVAFLLCGIIPWLWFSKSVNQSGSSISRGKGLISQTYLPKPFFPLVIIGQALVKQAFVFLLLFVFLFIYDYFPSIGWLWLIPIVMTQLLLIIAISFIVAFIVPFARDIQYLIDAALRMTMFGSGIFYSYKQVFLPEHRDIFLMNPMANLIANYRRVLMEDIEPLTGSLVIISLLSISIILLMTRVMKRHNNTLTLLALE
jgi:lipopolysaccharide transport system permease protein